MGKNKQKKFAEVRTFPNVFQVFDHLKPELENNEGQIVNYKGKWRSEYFNNDYPITVELACGKGDYTLALAKKYPAGNFVGVDIKGARIWTGAKKALEEDLNNVAFLRMRIENITEVFAENEIDEIWITFPDPFLKKERRRLTSPRFLNEYKKILKPEGVVHLKTDSNELFEFTEEVVEQENLQQLKNITDIYALPDVPEILQIKTFYEQGHLEAGKKIKYISFKL